MRRDNFFSLEERSYEILEYYIPIAGIPPHVIKQVLS
jgi:hypothetical protein